MEAIETFKVGDFTVEVRYDEGADSPREWSNVGELWTWERRCRSPEEPKLDRGDFDTWADFDAALEAQGRVVLPVYKYEHGGVAYSTGAFGCPWDSGRVGVISAPKGAEGLTDAQIREALEGEVKAFSSWANGDVYGYPRARPRGRRRRFVLGLQRRHGRRKERRARERGALRQGSDRRGAAGRGGVRAVTIKDDDGYCYGFTAGTYERRCFRMRPEQNREHAIRVVERWLRLFWARHVAHLAKHHSGSIAHAICADTPELIVWEHRYESGSYVVRCEPWTRILERALPTTERP